MAAIACRIMIFRNEAYPCAAVRLHDVVVELVSLRHDMYHREQVITRVEGIDLSGLWRNFAPLRETGKRGGVERID